VIFEATSYDVIPAKADIQKAMLLDFSLAGVTKGMFLNGLSRHGQRRVEAIGTGEMI